MLGACTGGTVEARRAWSIPGGPGPAPPRAGRASILLCALALLCGPLAAAAQEATPPAGPEAPEPPTVTVLGGMGVSMGWFGGQVSVYTMGGRVSGHAGVG